MPERITATDRDVNTADMNLDNARDWPDDWKAAGAAMLIGDVLSFNDGQLLAEARVPEQEQLLLRAAQLSLLVISKRLKR